MTWEYKIINQLNELGLLTEHTLNRFGERGWELVTVFPTTVRKGQSSHSYIFKRLRTS